MRKNESKDIKKWNPAIVEGSGSLMESQGSLDNNGVVVSGKAKFKRGSINSIDLKNKLKNSRFLASRDNSAYLSQIRSTIGEDS